MPRGSATGTATDVYASHALRCYFAIDVTMAYIIEFTFTISQVAHRYATLLIFATFIVKILRYYILRHYDAIITLRHVLRCAAFPLSLSSPLCDTPRFTDAMMF